MRKGNRESDEPWLVLTRKGKEGEWIIQAAVIKNISVGLFSEIKVLCGVSRGPSPALNLGCGQGRRDCCIRRPYSFLWYLRCDPFSPVHLHIWHKVGTKEVTEMEFCHKGILDRKFWGTRDDLCRQRNRGGPSIGKETGWDQWWVSQILWIRYFKIILNLCFNKHFNILTCTIMLIMASSCLFFSVTS